MSYPVAGRRSGWAPSVPAGLWVLAFLWFGVGDLVTTLFGLGVPGITEVGPVAAPLLAWFGPVGMVVLKAGAFAAFYVLWRVTPRPYAVGVPLGLVVVGVAVTCWNLVVIGVALPA